MPGRHWLICLIGAFAVMLGGCGNSSTGGDSPADDGTTPRPVVSEALQGEFLKTAVARVIIPGYQQLSQSTGSLLAQARMFCAERSTARFEALQEQWRQTMAAWQAMRWLAQGPIRFAHRFDRIEGWPRASAAVVQARVDMLVGQAGSPDAPAMNLALIEAQPVQAQGLPALEFLLFGSADVADFSATAAGDRRCAMLVAVSENLAIITQAVLDSWQGQEIAGVPDDYGRGLLGSQSESILTIFNVLANQMRGGLAEVRREMLGGPLGLTGTASEPSPNKLNLQSSRSETSLEHVITNLAAIEKLFMPEAGNFAGLLVAADQPAALEQFNTAMANARSLAQRMQDDGISLNSAFESPALVARAVDVYEAVRTLDEIWLDPVMPAAGATASFNFNDGD